MWYNFKSFYEQHLKMESYCLMCIKNSEKIDPKVSASSNGRAMILSKCAICDSKKPRFIKNQVKKSERTIK